MKHPIELAFEKEITRPGVSTFIAFTRAVRGRGFDRFKIGKFFNKLVDKDEYEKRCKESLVLQITALSPLK